MKGQFILFLSSKEFYIPSDFNNLSNVKQNIYQTLINSHKYEVKSQVHDDSLQSFIDYWVKMRIPDLSYDKYLIDYIQLSEEFGIMKNLIQLFLKNTSYSNISWLMQNKKLKHRFQKKKNLLTNEANIFKRNIEIIFKNESAETQKNAMIDSEYLFYSLKKGDFEGVEFTIKEKIEIDDYLYILNESDRTAQVYETNEYENLFIPSTINYNSVEYKITSLRKLLFRDLNYVKVIIFDENSEIKSFDVTCPSVEIVSLPDSITELNDSWCNETPNLTKIIISPNNKNFVYYEDKFLLGKSDQKSDVFDILCFARRDIEYATIPSFIRIISPYAFALCNKLEQIEFSTDSQLQIIGEKAFSFSGLNSIVIPKHVTKIGNEAFNQCKFLTNVEFSSNSELKIIGKGAFVNSSIERIVIPYSVVFIDDFTFSECANLKSIEFSEKSELKMIGKKAFVDTQIDSIKIPSSVLIIKEIFSCCYLLQKVDFSENSELRIIGDFTFYYTGLKRIVIPSHVILIGGNAFHHCHNLEEVEFAKNSELRMIGDSAFGVSTLKRIKIPSHVIIIGAQAFEECKFASFSFEENSELKFIGNKSFAYTSFESFTIPSNVTQINENAFEYCKNLINVVFSNNSKIKSIPSLFPNSSIKSITIPDSLIELKDGLGNGASDLIEVKISPNNKNFVYYEDKFLLGKSDQKSDVFDILCFARRDIEYAAIPSFIRIISPYAFALCNKLEQIEFSTDSQLQIIRYGAFFDSSIQSISIPSHVTKIESYAFYFCTKLQKVEFMNVSELKIIENEAFQNSSLTEIMIPSSVIELKESVFAECNELVKVEFANKSSLKSIKNSLFNESSITQLSLPDSLVNFDASLFDKVEKLNEIKISPNNKNFIYYKDKYLIGKSNTKSDIFDILYFVRRDIKKAEIPSFIRIISQNAFNSCKLLEKVEFSNDSQLNLICKGAFAYSSLNYIVIPSSVTEICCGAFSRSSIQRIEFEPNSKLKIINDQAFFIHYSNLFVRKIGDEAFRSCYCLESVDFSENSKLSYIGKDAFYATKIKSLLIPSSLILIEKDILFYCSKLQIIEIEEGSKLPNFNIIECIKNIIIMIPVNIIQTFYFKAKYDEEKENDDEDEENEDDDEENDEDEKEYDQDDKEKDDEKEGAADDDNYT
ncbi:hypothetical protein M9Y10_023791 [Tritrichomonas musculus]|uniref:Surface antigen BspA-like n=1 Tax=Tritrichomonas musculus TaxID=1915356 RepID=A0ABR2KW45_9EUKA